MTIADAAGFARAAARLHLSQPVLSRQIRALEGERRAPPLPRPKERTAAS